MNLQSICHSLHRHKLATFRKQPHVWGLKISAVTLNTEPETAESSIWSPFVLLADSFTDRREKMWTKKVWKTLTAVWDSALDIHPEPEEVLGVVEATLSDLLAEHWTETNWNPRSSPEEHRWICHYRCCVSLATIAGESKMCADVNRKRFSYERGVSRGTVAVYADPLCLTTRLVCRHMWADIKKEVVQSLQGSLRFLGVVEAALTTRVQHWTKSSWRLKKLSERIQIFLSFWTLCVW